jgi:hypothetical protein
MSDPQRQAGRRVQAEPPAPLEQAEQMERSAPPEQLEHLRHPVRQAA